MLILILLTGICLTLVIASLFLLRPATSAAAPSPAFDVYRIENKVVYYTDLSGKRTVVTDAHARTFQVLAAGTIGEPAPSQYARDFEHVYFQGAAIPGADPVYFRILGPDLGRDDRHVFKAHHLLSADARNFKRLDDHLSKDSRRVYYDDQVISEDAGNFRFIGKWQKTCFYKDQSKVFVNGKSFRVADIDTFDYDGNGIFTDRYQTYQFTGDGTAPGFERSSGQPVFRSSMPFQPAFA